MSNKTYLTPSAMSASDVLTTGEAAKACGVHLRTVLRWIERGLLHAYQLPGRGDHRVSVDELRRFMREHGIPDRMLAMPARRALIVDDEPAMAHAIGRVLKRTGFETAIATDGFAAGALVYSFQPGLMTLDLKMPGLDGIAVLRFLREAAMPTPLQTLVVTADTEQRVQEALALGAAAALRKPFANEELLAAVDRLCPAALAA